MGYSRFRKGCWNGITVCCQTKTDNKAAVVSSSRRRLIRPCSMYTGTCIALTRSVVLRKINSVSLCYLTHICTPLIHSPSAEISLLCRLIVRSSLFFTSYRLLFLSWRLLMAPHSCAAVPGEERVISPISSPPPGTGFPLLIFTFLPTNHPSRCIMTPNKNLIFSWWIYSQLSLDREIYSVFIY